MEVVNEKVLSRARGTNPTMGKGAMGIPSRTIVQAQLETTQPGDRYEQEADAAAALVMRRLEGGSFPSPSVQPAMPSVACFGGGGIRLSTQMESQLSAMSGGGHSMPAALQQRMESGFGRSLSDVRLHTDAPAADLSARLHAKAFAHGNDIYFAHGQYQPETTDGQHLIAHEVAHTMQQSGVVGREPFEGYSAAVVDFSNRYKKKSWGFAEMKSIESVDDFDVDVLLFSGHHYAQCNNGEAGVFSSNGTRTSGGEKYKYFYLKNLKGNTFDKVKLIISTSCATLSKDNLQFKSFFPNLKAELGYVHSAPGDRVDKFISEFLKKLGNVKVNIENDIEKIKKAWLSAGNDVYGPKRKEYNTKNMLAVREWESVDDEVRHKLYKYKKDSEPFYEEVKEDPEIRKHECFSPPKENDLFTTVII